MTRKTSTKNNIAILATGDEIIYGDILNTNSQVISQKLFKLGMRPGMQMTVPDNIEDIEEAILYLLKNHKALIITGGLGPTSDDLTRYGLSKAVNKSLEFNTTIWNDICERLKSLGFMEPPPEGNRQQALFPQGATVIPNPNGTAAGCMVEQNSQVIFMLPGPPIECLPLIDDFVIPTLKNLNFQQTLYFDHWLLFGVSEGVIAEELDNLVKNYECTTGYRLFYPYIEFKLLCQHKYDFELLLPKVKKIIEPYLLLDGKQTATATLEKTLRDIVTPLNIRDLATGGLLESVIKTPHNANKINFNNQNPDITIEGLENYWAGKKSNETRLKLHFANGQIIEKSIPFRVDRVKMYASEWIANQICLYIAKSFKLVS